MTKENDQNTFEFGPDVEVNQAAYIDPTARMFGKVSLAEGTSLWPYAVIRAEMHEVQVGRFSNFQDHVGASNPTIIGDYCSITHQAMVHGATVGDNSMLG
jgi:carbonic anhydrase/acetyltransferase-like protein (isoleucine patch superfamily)